MRSIHMLGADTAAEWQLIDQLGGPPNRFFQLAQRIAWGITQPDLLRVDVIDTARRLVRSHGSQFPAHLFDAWVWRAREPARAERALATARSLATPDHPLALLLPTDAEWRAETTPQRLVEVVPGQIWRVRHLFEMAGGPFHIQTTATIVRTGSGDLAIFNPVGLTDEVAAQITALGPVRWACSQGKAHSAYLEPTRRRFPGAQTLATEGHLRHPGAAHLQIDGLLGRVALPAELELFPLDGHLLQEICVLHRPTSTLITQDLFTDRSGNTPWIGRLYSFAWGVSHLGFASYATPMWTNIKKLHASVRAVRESGFTRHATAHGPEQIDDPTSLAAMRAGLDYALGLSPAGHKLLAARFFAAQPGFLRDMIIYLRATKGANGAKLRMGDA